jgi:hypothetical protein
MPVKININPRQVQAKVMGAFDKNLFALTSEIIADCNEYCKRSPDHTMRDSSLIHSRPGEGLMIWSTPYARRQYWEIKTALTPGTTWRWVETAKKRHMARWQALAQKGVNENL